MARETPIDCILDVLELIERIERQTANLTRETFIADADVQDATAYRILAIGEHRSSLSMPAKCVPLLSIALYPLHHH